MIYKFRSPIFIDMPRKTIKDKRRYLNLNAYRNWNFIISNNVKQEYTKLMTKTHPKTFKQLKQVKITYYFYKRNKRHIDLTNVTSVVDKFFQDYLVKVGVLEDDTTEFVLEVKSKYMGLDKDKIGYINIEVEEINK